MDRDADRTRDGPVTDRRSARSPSACPLRMLLSEGPVRFLLVSGDLDDGAWGVVGAFWLSIDGERGGFFVSPRRCGAAARWSAATGAPGRAAGPTATSTRYWQGQVGIRARS